jgi:hypothetical protein
VISDALVSELRRISEEFPLGALVWHRANLGRAVVTGWEICSRDVLVVADCGPGGDTFTALPCELTGIKPTDDSDGEEWKAADA